MEEDDTGELIVPEDPRDTVGDLLLYVAAAAGIAGCLMWDVGPVFYFVPLSLAGFGFVCLIGGLNLANRARILLAVVAAASVVGAGAIGIDKKGELDEISSRTEQAVDDWDY